jgi:hypothetical protein
MFYIPVDVYLPISVNKQDIQDSSGFSLQKIKVQDKT